jgi:hypothetical protein
MRNAAISALRNLAVRGAAESASMPSFPLAAALSPKEQPSHILHNSRERELQRAVSYPLFRLVHKPVASLAWEAPVNIHRASYLHHERFSLRGDHIIIEHESAALMQVCEKVAEQLSSCEPPALGTLAAAVCDDGRDACLAALQLLLSACSVSLALCLAAAGAGIPQVHPFMLPQAPPSIRTHRCPGNLFTMCHGGRIIVVHSNAI